jgi:hypothetical protein
MHPLAPKLSELSDDDLLKKLNELYGRLAPAMHMGDPSIAMQLRMLLDDYQGEYDRRMAEQAAKFAENNKKLTDKIDIS